MIDWLTYIVNSLVWSLVGFVLGWFGARVGRDVKTIREAVVTDDSNVGHEQHTIIEHPSASRWLGIVVALLAVVTVGQGVIVQQRLGNVTDCQTTYNSQFAAVSTRRAALADEDRQALTNMLITLYQKRDATTEERKRIFAKWVRTTQSNEVERREHPLPELPKGDCR